MFASALGTGLGNIGTLGGLQAQAAQQAQHDAILALQQLQMRPATVSPEKNRAQEQRKAQGQFNHRNSIAFNGVNEAQKLPDERKNSMVRDYLNRHKDILFTLVMAILVDHFILGGALRHRIRAVIEAALNRIEKALGLPPPETDVK